LAKILQSSKFSKDITGFPENSSKQNWLSNTTWLSESSFNERLSKTHASPGKALASFDSVETCLAPFGAMQKTSMKPHAYLFALFRAESKAPTTSSTDLKRLLFFGKQRMHFA